MAEPLFGGACIPGDIAAATEPPHVPAAYAGTATELYLRYTGGSATTCTVTIYRKEEDGGAGDSQAVAMGAAVFKTQAINWTVAKTDYFYAVVDSVVGGTPEYLVWQVRP